MARRHMHSHLAQCLHRRRGRRGRYVGLDLVPHEFEFGDEFATVRRRRGVFVHGVDQCCYISAFGLCPRQVILLFPSIPSHVNYRYRNMPGVCSRVPTYHFSFARSSCSLLPSGRSMMPSTSPSAMHQPLLLRVYRGGIVYPLLACIGHRALIAWRKAAFATPFGSCLQY